MIERLFPCRSVTGAPKIRAMEAIRGLEAAPRRAYAGGIGCIGPERAGMNVAIRTLSRQAGASEGRIGLGSGIVADSKAGAEWAECLAKGRFFVAGPPGLRLIETMRADADEVSHCWIATSQGWRLRPRRWGSTTLSPRSGRHSRE